MKKGKQTQEKKNVQQKLNPTVETTHTVPLQPEEVLIKPKEEVF